MAPSDEAIERARLRRTGAPQCAGPSGEGGRPVTVTAVGLGPRNAADFRFPGAMNRIVAAKVDFGFGWGLLGDGGMKIQSREHPEEGGARRSPASPGGGIAT